MKIIYESPDVKVEALNEADVLCGSDPSVLLKDNEQKSLLNLSSWIDD